MEPNNIRRWKVDRQLCVRLLITLEDIYPDGATADELTAGFDSTIPPTLVSKIEDCLHVLTVLNFVLCDVDGDDLVYILNKVKDGESC